MKKITLLLLLFSTQIIFAQFNAADVKYFVGTGTKTAYLVVDFNDDASKISEAESAGVKSVPALVLNGQTYHINHGASMEEVKNG